MDIIKKNLAHIVIGVAATSLVLYLLLRKSESPEKTDEPGNQFRDIIDQRALQHIREMQGKEWMIKYVNEHLTGKLRTEKGVLNRQDFNHILKVIETYVKALLYDLRNKHQDERVEMLRNKDIENYIKTVVTQLDIEAEYFGRAQGEVKQVAKVNDTAFYASHNEYSNDKQSLRDTIEFSLTSPFKPLRGFTK